MDWEWYHDSKTFHLFIHLLINANHQPKKWRGITIERGQFLTGRHTLKGQTGISEQSIRTSLERLKSTSEITIQSTNQFSIITLCNYSKYQDGENGINQQINQPANQQVTSNQPASNHKQEVKELKNGNNKNYSPNSDEFRLAELLLSLIRKHNPTHKQPNIQQWAKHLDLMIRIDKRVPDEIKEIIIACQKDSFWYQNILSTKTLREKYDQLKIKLIGGQNGRNSRNDDRSAVLEALRQSGRRIQDIET